MFHVSRFMKKGFTLIEALVVIAIIGIMAAAYFSASQFAQPSARLSAAARNLVTDLRYAQQLSAAQQTEHGIHFSVAESTYQLTRFGTTTQQLFDKALPGGVTFQGLTGFIGDEARFNAYGAAVATGTVSLINTESETKTIQVRPSGFVRIL